MSARTPFQTEIFSLTLRGGWYDDFHGLDVRALAATGHLERAVREGVAELWREENPGTERQDLFSRDDVSVRLRRLTDNCATPVFSVFKRPQAEQRRGARADTAGAEQADRDFERLLPETVQRFERVLVDVASARDVDAIEADLSPDTLRAWLAFLEPQFVAAADAPYGAKPVTAEWRREEGGEPVRFDAVAVDRLRVLAERVPAPMRSREGVIGRVCKVELDDPRGGLTLFVRESNRKRELPLTVSDIGGLQESQRLERAQDLHAPLVRLWAEVERDARGRLERILRVDGPEERVDGPRLEDRRLELHRAVDAARAAQEPAELGSQKLDDSPAVPFKKRIDEAVELAWRLLETSPIPTRPFVSVLGEGQVALEWDIGPRTLRVTWLPPGKVMLDIVDLAAATVESCAYTLPDGAATSGRRAFADVVLNLGQRLAQEWAK